MNIWQIICDVIIVLIIAFSVLWGYKRGFVKSFFQSSKLLLVILATFLIGSFVVTLCQDTFVEPMLEGKISEKLVARAEQMDGEFNFEVVEEEIPTIVKNLIPMASVKQQFSTISGEKTEVASAIGTRIEGVLVNIVSNIVGYILSFIVAFTVLSVVIWLLDKFFSLPVLNVANRLAGIVWGIASAYLTTSTLVCIISLFFGNEFVNGTIVTKFIYYIGLFSF